MDFPWLLGRRRGGPMVPVRGPKGVAPARTHQRVPVLFYLLGQVIFYSDSSPPGYFKKSFDREAGAVVAGGDPATSGVDAPRPWAKGRRASTWASHPSAPYLSPVPCKSSKKHQHPEAKTRPPPSSRHQATPPALAPVGRDLPRPPYPPPLTAPAKKKSKRYSTILFPRGPPP